MYVYFSIISEGTGKGFVYSLSLHKYICYSTRKYPLATVPLYTEAITRWDKVTQDLAYIIFKKDVYHELDWKIIV